MNSDDDDRAVDWAPNQIRRLEERINDLATRLTGETQRLNELRRMHHGLVKQSADEVERLERRIVEIEAMNSDAIKAVWSETVRELDPEFSPPIGARPVGAGLVEEILFPKKRAGDTGDRTHLRGTGTPARHGGIFAIGSEIPGRIIEDRPFERGSMAAVFEASWERGYEAGRRAAVDEAESRIVAALDKIDMFGRHRDEVLSALRDVLSTKTGNDARREEETALQLAENRVVEKLMEMGWALGSPAMLGVINALRGTKPIKDAPQG